MRCAHGSALLRHAIGIDLQMDFINMRNEHWAHHIYSFLRSRIVCASIWIFNYSFMNDQHPRLCSVPFMSGANDVIAQKFVPNRSIIRKSTSKNALCSRRRAFTVSTVSTMRHCNFIANINSNLHKVYSHDAYLSWLKSFLYSPTIQPISRYSFVVSNNHRKPKKTKN